MKRQATAQWQGDLKTGKGAISSESGVLAQTPYSFTTRFEGTKGTNPEELIAAAHAGCFTMALSAMLTKEGFTAKQLQTQATVTLDQVDGNWTVTQIDLMLDAQVDNIDQATLQKIALNAKENCPISRLMNAKINLNFKS